MGTFHSIRTDVERLASRITENCRQELPSQPCALAGEVLEIWARGDRWEMTLRDVKNEERSIGARLPISGRKPLVGYTICIVGRYDVELDPIDASFRLVFEGTHRDPSWEPKEPALQRERRDVIRRLRENMAPPARLEVEPQSIVLVTSRGGTAVQDFRAGLGKEGDVPCQEISIPLEGGTTTDIADGIRRAGELNVDLIVIARGGGRQVMLQRFSNVDVIRAVADVGTHTPIVVAIGHERDKVDAEKFAWQRASTPSGAGALVAEQIRILRWRARQVLKNSPLLPSSMSPSLRAVSSLTPYPLTHTAPASPQRRSVKNRSRRRILSVRALLWIVLLGGIASFGWTILNRGHDRISSKGPPSEISADPAPQSFIPALTKSSKRSADQRSRRRDKDTASTTRSE